MGFVKQLVGGGNSGMGFQAQGWEPTQAASMGQINTAYDQTQTGLSQQQDFINALAAQGGIGNQASVFAQQQALSNQFGQMAQGQGPNPALAQFNQASGQNVAQQAALMAGQRGASQNVGLMARQIGQQGAGIQQNAVGQAATLQAQQQIAAAQMQQQQQAQMAAVAGQQVGQQAGAIQGYNQAAQSQQQNLLSSMANWNNANVAMRSNQNSSNAGLQGIVAGKQGDILGGLMGGAGAALMPKAAHGGIVQNYADGGMAGPSLGVNTQLPTMDAGLHGFLFGSAPPNNQNPQPIPQQQVAPPPVSALEGGSSKLMQGLVKAAPMLIAASHGAVVPGKAKIKGDDLKNDKVPALLSPQEIILPRSVTMSPNAPEMAAKFVAAVLAKQGLKK